VKLMWGDARLIANNIDNVYSSGVTTQLILL
jgi:hypothetical protein